jgi:xanthine/uracil/vitamin C permease (AzgA family)
MLERLFKLQANGTTVRREVKPLLYVLAVQFVLYHVFFQP